MELFTKAQDKVSSRPLLSRPMTASPWPLESSCPGRRPMIPGALGSANESSGRLGVNQSGGRIYSDHQEVPWQGTSSHKLSSRTNFTTLVLKGGIIYKNIFIALRFMFSVNLTILNEGSWDKGYLQCWTNTTLPGELLCVFISQFQPNWWF